MDDKLNEVREWAKAKIATCVEPPWTWYHYMKLIETIDTILGGEKTAIPTEKPQQSHALQKHLRRLDPNSALDISLVQQSESVEHLSM